MIAGSGDSHRAPYRRWTMAAGLAAVLLGLLPFPNHPAQAQEGRNFKNALSGKCLDVLDRGTANGANVQQFDCLGDQQTNQVWRTVTNPEGGIARIVATHSDKCLDVATPFAGAGKQNGANVQQWACSDGLNQSWALIPTGPGLYLIVSLFSGKCLDVEGGSTANNANVQQWECHGRPNQIWRAATPINVAQQECEAGCWRKWEECRGRVPPRDIFSECTEPRNECIDGCRGQP
jgi:Ricin-type beta-trefoil lectin domain